MLKKHHKNRKFKFAGVEIDNLTVDELKYEIEQMLKFNQKGYIVTPNAAHIVLLQKDNDLKKAYIGAKFVVPDGMSLILISKFFLFPLKARITGYLLFNLLCEMAQKQGYRVFFLGGESSIQELLIKRIKNLCPNLEISGVHHGFFQDDNEVIKKINENRTDILFIGMGCPKQEKWIAKNIKFLDVKVAVCIGGVLAVIAGRTKLAPLWIQKIGLEWLWRLIQEPKRLWKRYLISNTVFLWLVFKELIKKIFWKND